MLRAALTQTRNAYQGMPSTVDELASLAGEIEAIRNANLEHHAELIREAAGRGVRAICLGELFAAPYFAITRLAIWRDLAEDAADGPSVSRMRELASEHGMVTVAPIYELDARSGERYNTAVVIDADGEIAGLYRKTHIPSGANEQGCFDELFYYKPGVAPDNSRYERAAGPNKHFPVFRTSVGVVGVATCYDRHFEGVMSSLARGGARLVFSPAVTFGEKSRRMWDLEFPVDAARHNIFIGGSNRLGAETPWNQEFFGASYFTGPNGKLDNLSNHPNLVISDIDLDELDRPDPSGWSIGRDTRPSIYG